MPKPSPIRYRTTNWSDYNAALRKRGSLSVWFDPETVWHADKTGKRGRPETFSDAAIQTCRGNRTRGINRTPGARVKAS